MHSGHELCLSTDRNNFTERACRILSGLQLSLSAVSSLVLVRSEYPRRLAPRDGWRSRRIPGDTGATRSGSEPRRGRGPKPCEVAACADAISRKRRAPGASPMSRVAQVDIGMG